MKKNKLTTAVIAGLAGVAGVASVGNAVHVNPEGTGQVLIYPYYTVNNGLNTTYSVVNTTDQVKAIKVRFLEGHHSREVLDFNVYLSPFDVWTGVLVPAVSSYQAGENTGEHRFGDNSCTPLLNNNQQFLPWEIQKDAAAGNSNMQRTTDGHFEVLEMGVVTGPLAAAATHSNGVPASCAALTAAWSGGGTWDLSRNADMIAPTGGLFGAASIIDVAEGFNVSYDAIALDDWRDSPDHTDPGSLLPSIASVSPATSNVFVDGAVLTDSWLTAPAQAVSATLMRSEIYNEYNFEAAVEGKSAWVVTFPTKYHHVDSSSPVAPFSNSWDGVNSCDEFSLKKWDREERTEVTVGGISPSPPDGENPSFCKEANTLEFIAPGGTVGSSNILGGNNLTSVQGVNGGTENGWARVQFNASSNVMTGSANTYYGLPAAGFMVQRFTNNNAAPGVMAQYGGLFNHKGLVNSGN